MYRAGKDWLLLRPWYTLSVNEQKELTSIGIDKKYYLPLSSQPLLYSGLGYKPDTILFMDPFTSTKWWIYPKYITRLDPTCSEVVVEVPWGK